MIPWLKSVHVNTCIVTHSLPRCQQLEQPSPISTDDLLGSTVVAGSSAAPHRQASTAAAANNDATLLLLLLLLCPAHLPGHGVVWLCVHAVHLDDSIKEGRLQQGVTGATTAHAKVEGGQCIWWSFIGEAKQSLQRSLVL
jgi:hypothetical protein